MSSDIRQMPAFARCRHCRQRAYVHRARAVCGNLRLLCISCRKPLAASGCVGRAPQADAKRLQTVARWVKDDRDGIENRWKPSIQLDEEEATSVCEVNTTTHLPPEYDQLMSEHHVLCLKSALRLEWWRDQEGQEEAKQRNHRAADVRRFAYLINTNEVFGTHRSGRESIDRIERARRALPPTFSR